jgi:hypothetical protein
MKRTAKGKPSILATLFQKPETPKQEIKPMNTVTPEWIDLPELRFTQVMNTPKGSFLKGTSNPSTSTSIAYQEGVWYDQNNNCWVTVKPV